MKFPAYSQSIVFMNQQDRGTTTLSNLKIKSKKRRMVGKRQECSFLPLKNIDRLRIRIYLFDRDQEMAKEGFGNNFSHQIIVFVLLLLLISAIGPGFGFSDDLKSRTFSIKIAADSQLRAKSKWEFKIRSRLRHCSHIFENRFGL